MITIMISSLFCDHKNALNKMCISVLHVCFHFYLPSFDCIKLIYQLVNSPAIAFLLTQTCHLHCFKTIHLMLYWIVKLSDKSIPEYKMYDIYFIYNRCLLFWIQPPTEFLPYVLISKDIYLDPTHFALITFPLYRKRLHYLGRQKTITLWLLM